MVVILFLILLLRDVLVLKVLEILNFDIVNCEWMIIDNCYGFVYESFKGFIILLKFVIC